MFQIRPMESSDITQVAALEAKIFSRPWSAESFQKALTYPEQILLVAELEDAEFFMRGKQSPCVAENGETDNHQSALCGYAVLYAAAGQADVSNIAVDPDYRGKKIGDALMKEMLCRAKDAGVSEVFLEVRVSNDPAIGLYRKYGFEQISVRKNYYDAPTEDALLMRAEI